MLCVPVWDEGQEVLMLNLYFVYNGHCQFFLGTFNNVDDLIERMEDINGHSRLLLTQGFRSTSESEQHDSTTVLRTVIT